MHKKCDGRQAVVDSINKIALVNSQCLTSARLIELGRQLGSCSSNMTSLLA